MFYIDMSWYVEVENNKSLLLQSVVYFETLEQKEI